MIDAHIHLDDPRFDSDRQQIIEQAIAQGIDGFVVPSVGVWNFKSVLQLSKAYANVFVAFGLHPYFLEKHQASDLETLESWLNHPNCIAVGECGLDFYLKNLDKTKQLEFFKAQIILAKKHQLPLILHARGAVEEIYNQLREADYFKATIHSYNGSLQQTQKLIDKGMVFSFGGAICNPRAKKLHELLKYIPADFIMFETDAPDQSPYPDHKARNTPAKLKQIIQTYAKITQTDEQQAIATSRSVTQKFFQLK